MKKSILLTAFVISFGGALLAQTAPGTTLTLDKKFTTGMEKNLLMLDTATTASTFISLANNFERIGKAEQKKWQPYYFAALAYGLMASNNPDKSKADFLTDNALEYLTLAEGIEKNNSEINTLFGMILFTKVSVDPVTRWQTLGMEAIARLDKAKQLDPSNPRPWFIDANAKLRIPEALGGGPKVARLALETSLEKFRSFIPENSIAPNWGKSQAERILKSLPAQ